jgi:AcrR family transcriptional regulator
MAGRPREFDRNAALALARNLFWKRGYEGVSMADLAQTLGLASARIYAAFGSKEELFKTAIELYEEQEGGFADRAIAEELTVFSTLERMFDEAIRLYTRKQNGNPLGCMVVSAATNCASENTRIGQWLAEHRRARTASIVRHLKEAIRRGELPKNTDAQSLGDLFATFLHGLSVQARDGVSRERLLATIPHLMSLLKVQIEQSEVTAAN